MIEGEFQSVADCGYLVLIVDLRLVWAHGVKSSPVEVMKQTLVVGVLSLLSTILMCVVLQWVYGISIVIVVIYRLSCVSAGQ